jgi:hypothetical protein
MTTDPQAAALATATKWMDEHFGKWTSVQRDHAMRSLAALILAEREAAESQVALLIATWCGYNASTGAEAHDAYTEFSNAIEGLEQKARERDERIASEAREAGRAACEQIARDRLAYYDRSDPTDGVTWHAVNRIADAIAARKGTP